MKQGFVSKNGLIFDKILPASSEYCPVFEHKVRSDYVPVIILMPKDIERLTNLFETMDKLYGTKTMTAVVNILCNEEEK